MSRTAGTRAQPCIFAAVNNTTPAIVPQSAVRRLPRLALILFCVAYVLPGFLGREPWKLADVSAFGVMLEMAAGHSSWWHPQVLGVPVDEAGPLPYWLGAAFIRLLPFLPADFAARIPFGLLLALTLACTWYAVYHLARQKSAQPVAFAFGGEANPVDYARTLADAALLALVACLGLAQLSHETTPDLARLAMLSALLLGAARLAQPDADHPGRSVGIWGAAAAGAGIQWCPVDRPERGLWLAGGRGAGPPGINPDGECSHRPRVSPAAERCRPAAGAGDRPGGHQRHDALARSVAADPGGWTGSAGAGCWSGSPGRPGPWRSGPCGAGAGNCASPMWRCRCGRLMVSVVNSAINPDFRPRPAAGPARAGGAGGVRAAHAEPQCIGADRLVHADLLHRLCAGDLDRVDGHADRRASQAGGQRGQAGTRALCPSFLSGCSLRPRSPVWPGSGW